MSFRFLILYFYLIIGSNSVGLAQDGQPWRKAVAPWDWQFPRDHGSHPEFQTEWWYFTGNLQDEKGRPFGYQLTFFRQGVLKNPQQKSAWALRDIYFAHFAVSDIQDNQFHFFERNSRGALGLADYSQAGMNIRLEDWKLTQTGKDSFNFAAQGAGVELKLNLKMAKPKVFHGNKGLSQKSAEVGNASYYYSYTRMESEGILKLKERKFRVQGKSWFDHEISSSFLAHNHVGWDWFSIQLDSGEDIMLYKLRLREGGSDPYSHGSLIEIDGTKKDLKLDDYKIKVTKHWKSGKSQGIYPAGWRVEIPSEQINLTITPAMADQELRLKGLGAINYWEGSCVIEGVRKGQPVRGRGYVELTGYAGELGTQGRSLRE
ncbi:MAG: lipocalin-like domain-containing protein [Blastochloris sp.]|nr:lipocalin-like domain-containing protein [Blastochloris sp.]